MHSLPTPSSTFTSFLLRLFFVFIVVFNSCRYCTPGLWQPGSTLCCCPWSALGHSSGCRQCTAHFTARHKSFHLRAGSSAREHVADVQKDAFRGLQLSGLLVEASNLEQLIREAPSQRWAVSCGGLGMCEEMPLCKLFSSYFPLTKAKEMQVWGDFKIFFSFFFYCLIYILSPYR